MELDVNSKYQNAAITIQSAWRGHFIRRELMSINLFYKDLCDAIDGSEEYDVEIAQPVFKRPTIKFKNQYYSGCGHEDNQNNVEVNDEFEEENKILKYLKLKSAIKAQFLWQTWWNKEDSTENTESIKEEIDVETQENWTMKHLEENAIPEVEESLSKEELIKQKNSLTVELIWVQQAIQSRRDYLNLKQGYS